MTQFTLPDFDLDAFVRATLAEDLGAGGDITSIATIPADARFGGVMDSRDAIIVAALPLAERFFRALEPDMVIEILVDEAPAAHAGNELTRSAGPPRGLLPADPQPPTPPPHAPRHSQ